jgi:hypothetical protein
LKTDFASLMKVTLETQYIFGHFSISPFQHNVWSQSNLHRDVTGSTICKEHELLTAFTTKTTAKLLVVKHFE